MFALRARHARGDERRLSVEQLGLGGDDVGLGGGPGVILVLRDRDRALVIFDRPGEQILKRIRLSKRHIGKREGRLRGEQRVRENGGVRLRARLLRLDLAPDLTPDVERPRPGGFRGQIRAARQTASRRARAVDSGKEPGARLIDERQSLPVIGLVRLDRLVGHRDDPHELVKFRIVKNGPPLAFRLVRARRGDLPALDLLELRRHDRRRAFEVGTDRRTSGKRKSGDKRRARAQAKSSSPRPFGASRCARPTRGAKGRLAGPRQLLFLPP